MPVNFKATFETPILASYDAGEILNSDVLCEKIVQYYKETLKTGFPAGAPPTPFTTTEPNGRLMEEILKLYFQSKEIVALEAAIENIREGQQRTLEKEALLNADLLENGREQLELSQQIITLGLRLERILLGLIKLINNKIGQVTRIVESDIESIVDIDNLRQQGTNQLDSYIVRIETVREIPNLITNSLSDINVLNVAEKLSLVASIPTFLSTFLTELRTDASSGSILLQSTLKQLLQTISEIISILEVLKSRDVKGLEELALTNPEVRTIKENFEALNQESAILSRRLRKLKEQEGGLLNDINLQVTSKLENYTEQLKVKTSTLSKKTSRTEQKQTRLAFIKEKLEKVQEESEEKGRVIQEKLRRLEEITRVVQSVALIPPQLISLIGDIVNEGVTFAEEALEAGSKQALLFQQLGSIYAFEYDRINSQYRDLATNAKTGVNILTSLTDNIDDPVAVANAAAVSAIEIQTNIRTINENLSKSGISRFSQVILAPVYAGISGPFTISSFLESRRPKFNQIYIRAEDLFRRVETLTGRSRSNKFPKLENTISARELLVFLEKIFKKIEFIQARLERELETLGGEIVEIKERVEQKTKTLVENTFAPVAALIQSTREKANTIRERSEEQLRVSEDLQRISTAGVYLASAIKDGISLTSNISQGNFRLNENERVIDSLFANYIRTQRSLDGKSNLKSAISELITNSQPSVTNLTRDELEVFKQLQSIKDQWRIFESSYIILTAFINNPPPLDETLTIIRSSFANNRAVNSIRDRVVDFFELVSNTRNPIQVLNFIIALKLENFNIGPVENYLFSIEQSFPTFFPNIEGETGFLISVFRSIKKAFNRLKNKINVFVEKNIYNGLQQRIQRQRERIEAKAEARLKAAQEKQTDKEGVSLAAVINQSLKAFWAQATWVGAVQVQVINPGSSPILRLNVPADGGFANYIAEISKTMQAHLATVSGTYIQQTPVGPITLPWQGYI